VSAILVPNAERDAREAALAVESYRRFQSWCAMDGDEVPPNVVDRTQVRALRWRNREFGLPDDFRVLAGVVEEMGELAEATEPEKALDSLGDVMIFLGHLLAANRLAMSAVVDAVEDRMPESRYRETTWEPLAAVGALAHVLLKHADRIRGLAETETFRARLFAAAVDVVYAAALDAGPTTIAHYGGLVSAYEMVAASVMSRRRASYPGSHPEKEIGF
jgi:hypothetical protein